MIKVTEGCRKCLLPEEMNQHLRGKSALLKASLTEQLMPYWSSEQNFNNEDHAFLENMKTDRKACMYFFHLGVVHYVKINSNLFFSIGDYLTYLKAEE